MIAPMPNKQLTTNAQEPADAQKPPKKSPGLALILYLILIEHLIFPLIVAILEFVLGEESFITILTNMLSLSYGSFSRITIGLFIPRLVFGAPFLFFVFSDLKIRNVSTLAMLNVASNIMMLGSCVFILTFPEVLSGNLGSWILYLWIILTTSISPFIANVLPFSRRHVQEFMAH